MTPDQDNVNAVNQAVEGLGVNAQVSGQLPESHRNTPPAQTAEDIVAEAEDDANKSTDAT